MPDSSGTNRVGCPLPSVAMTTSNRLSFSGLIDPIRTSFPFIFSCNEIGAELVGESPGFCYSGNPNFRRSKLELPELKKIDAKIGQAIAVENAGQCARIRILLAVFPDGIQDFATCFYGARNCSTDFAGSGSAAIRDRQFYNSQFVSCCFDLHFNRPSKIGINHL